MSKVDLEEYKKNNKTSFLAGEYERLSAEEEKTLAMAQKDPQLQPLVEEELESLRKQKDILAQQMGNIVKKDKEEEKFPNELILEVRAGAGGDEAALFARELAEMYERYAEAKGWQYRVIDESMSSTDGYKEASIEFKGEGVYELLRFETGVHRIQRVPATEKMGRVHTSTASVAILPIRKNLVVEIKPTELEIEFSRSGGKGGQNVNKVETAVRIIHTPTGINVRCTSERSQQKNREKAMQIVTARLGEKRRLEAAEKLSSERKKQIGTGDRSEKIRTYNILQDRVTDHRIKESWHNVEGIFAGNIGQILEALSVYSDESVVEK